jgi:hypothetical protein
MEEHNDTNQSWYYANIKASNKLLVTIDLAILNILICPRYDTKGLFIGIKPKTKPLNAQCVLASQIKPTRLLAVSMPSRII